MILLQQLWNGESSNSNNSNNSNKLKDQLVCPHHVLINQDQTRNYGIEVSYDHVDEKVHDIHDECIYIVPPSKAMQQPGGGQQQQQQPMQPQQPSMIMSAPRPIAKERQWYDKLVDALVGEEGPETKYALICQHCFAHNGLVLPQEIAHIRK